MKRFLCLSFILALTALLVSAKGVMSEFRGVKPGMTQDEVRQKLGKPNREDDLEESYNIGDGNAMQVHYTSDKKVKTIVLYFYSNDEKVPVFADVVGEAAVEKGADGSERAKLVDPETNLSITMFRSAGSNPMTVITINQTL